MSFDLTQYVEVGECHEWTGRYDMGKRTGVGPAMVADIRRGKAWKPSVGAGSVFEWRPTA